MKVNFQIFLFLMVKKSVFCKNKRLMVDALIFKLISIQVLPFLVLTLSNLSEFFERAIQVLVVMLLHWQPFINCKLKENSVNVLYGISLQYCSINNDAYLSYLGITQGSSEKQHIWIYMCIYIAKPRCDKKTNQLHFYQKIYLSQLIFSHLCENVRYNRFIF